MWEANVLCTLSFWLHNNLFLRMLPPHDIPNLHNFHITHHHFSIPSYYLNIPVIIQKNEGGQQVVARRKVVVLT
jgi:hypothetical protein